MSDHVSYISMVQQQILFCIISEIKRDVVENRDFFIPLAFEAPVMGVPVGLLPSRLVWRNENGLATGSIRVTALCDS